MFVQHTNALHHCGVQFVDAELWINDEPICVIVSLTESFTAGDVIPTEVFTYMPLTLMQIGNGVHRTFQ
jgi:hypothetical protein